MALIAEEEGCEMLDFYFDYRSPYSYLANTQLPSMQVEIEYHVLDVLEVMRLVHNQPSPECPSKAQYSLVDAKRWADVYKVEWAPNRSLFAAMRNRTFDGGSLSRLALAASEAGIFHRVHSALFQVVWAGTDDLVTNEGRRKFLQRNDLELDLWERAESKAVLDKLHENNKLSASRGVFGVPSFTVGQELFFGNDRLDFVHAALKNVERGSV